MSHGPIRNPISAAVPAAMSVRSVMNRSRRSGPNEFSNWER